MQSFCFRGACNLGMVQGNQRWITRDSKMIPASDRCREGSNRVDENVLRQGNGGDVWDGGSGLASQSSCIWAETWTVRRIRQAKTWEVKVQARGKYWGDNGLRVQGAGERGEMRLEAGAASCSMVRVQVYSKCRREPLESFNQESASVCWVSGRSRWLWSMGGGEQRQKQEAKLNVHQ